MGSARREVWLFLPQVVIESGFKTGIRFALCINVNRLVSLYSLFLIFALGSCSNQEVSRSPQSIATASHAVYEKFSPEPLVVRLKEDQGSVLTSLKISYVGEIGIEETFKEASGQIQTLVVSSLAHFDLDTLKSESGRIQFQKEILSILDSFIVGNRLIRVELLEVRKI